MTNQIELRHLHYFLALTKTLHYGKAAEELLISQSALSQQIQRLEYILDTELFSRNNRKVVLNEAGLLFKEEVQLILTQVSHSLERWRLSVEGATGLIRIGFVASAMQHYLPPKIKRFTAMYPQVKLSLNDMSNEMQLNNLSKKQIDIGFIRTNKVPEGISCQSVHKENLCLVLPKNHSVNPANFKNIGQLAKENFILFPNQQSQLYYQQIMSLCADFGFSPKVSHKSIHAPTIFKLVENGLGISIIPKSLVNEELKTIQFIELDKVPYQTELFVAWNNGIDNKAIQTFLRLLKGN